MARRKTKNPLSRKQKLFRMESLNPLDANNVDVEEAISRLFVYLRKGGKQITDSDKPFFKKDAEEAATPSTVLDIALDANGERFSGVATPVASGQDARWRPGAAGSRRA